MQQKAGKGILLCLFFYIIFYPMTIIASIYKRFFYFLNSGDYPLLFGDYFHPSGD